MPGRVPGRRQGRESDDWDGEHQQAPEQRKFELRSQQSFLDRPLLRECREQSLANSVRYYDKPVAEERVKCHIDFEVGPVIAHRITSPETSCRATTKFPRVGKIREQGKLKPYENKQR